ncbi:MAG TPA: magnesium transporter CorA family protein [Chloroflexia bacterium]|nr:magnesium transporter CorA family protein [Chloroflexia bacterium]
MPRSLLRDEHNQFRVVEDMSVVSDIVQHKDRYLWLDLEKPSLGDFQMLQKEFGFHPLAIEDAMSRHQRPKVDQYETFYLVVFYSVSLDPDGTSGTPGRRGLKGTRFLSSGSKSHDNFSYFPHMARDKPGNPPDGGQNSNEAIVLNEVTMFMGENYLITVHDHPVAEIEEAARRWRRNVEIIGQGPTRGNAVPGTRPLTQEEQNQLKTQPGDAPGDLLPPIDIDSNGKGPHHEFAEKSTFLRPGQRAEPKEPTPRNGEEEGTTDIGILLYSLLDTIVDSYFPIIDSIVDRVEDLEQQIFEHYSQEAIESIFTLKKDLLALRKVFAPERDVLNVLTRRDIPIFDRHTLAYLQDVYDHIVRATDSIDTYRDLLSSALDSFLSMQSNRLNVTVQTLTAVSIMLMSVAAVTGWYGMNFRAMPELSSPIGYPGVISAVALLVVLEFIFFRRKHWL